MSVSCLERKDIVSVIGRHVKSLICKRGMCPVVWGVAFGLILYAGYFFGHEMIKVKCERFMQERYVVMPEQITDAWLKDCLSRVPGVRAQVFSPGSLRFFGCDSQVMGFLNYDRDEQLLSFVTGMSVKYNEYLYEIANYRNLAGNFQRLCFDDEKEFLSLMMEVDLAAGVTAGQVEHSGRIFVQAMANFYNDFMN